MIRATDKDLTLQDIINIEADALRLRRYMARCQTAAEAAERSGQFEVAELHMENYWDASEDLRYLEGGEV